MLAHSLDTTGGVLAGNLQELTLSVLLVLAHSLDATGGALAGNLQELQAARVSGPGSLLRE